MIFFRYAISMKEFTFTASDMVSTLKLNVKPSIFGKLLVNYKKELEKNGLVVECKRTATERLYTAKYKEPLEFDSDDLDSKEEYNGS